MIPYLLWQIKNIYFVGDKYFRSSDLIDIVSSGKENWWKFFSDNSTVNKDRLNYDESLLKNFYLNNGFYDVQITSVNTEIVSKNLANIIFSINSGEIYNYGKKFLIDKQNLLSPEQKTKVNDIIGSKLSSVIINKNIYIKLKVGCFLVGKYFLTHPPLVHLCQESLLSGFKF